MAETIVDIWDFKDLGLARSPAVKAGLDYWRSKHRDARLPSRAQLDPLEMRGFLAKILIIDIEDDDTFVFRLCGTEISDGNRRDLTGRRADQASLGASAPQFIDAYRRCMQARDAIFFIGQLWWQDRGHVAFEQVMLPLSSDGARVDKLLCVIDFEIFS